MLYFHIAEVSLFSRIDRPSVLAGHEPSPLAAYKPSPPMRILLANPSAHPAIGGVENSLRFIGQELKRAGHEVKIICFHSGSGVCRDKHQDIEIIRFPLQQRRWPHTRIRGIVKAASESVKTVLAEFEADAIWSRNAAMGMGVIQSGYSGPLLQIFPTSARMNCDGLYLRARGLPRHRRLMLKALWPFAYFPSARIERELAEKSIAIAFSNNMKSQLQRSFSGSAHVCHIIPPGVDSQLFSPKNGKRFAEKVISSYLSEAVEPIVLYVGRLSTAKNIPMLLDAISILKTRARLVLVGGGPDEAYLRSYAARIGIADRVVFAGVQNELLPGFYAVSRVTVLPTTIESFGQVYLESLATGTPAVGFAADKQKVLTATDEIIRHGQTGAIARTNNAESLSIAIESVLTLDEESYADMSKCARQDAMERFSWQSFVQAAVQLTSSASSKRQKN